MINCEFDLVLDHDGGHHGLLADHLLGEDQGLQRYLDTGLHALVLHPDGTGDPHGGLLKGLHLEDTDAEGHCG